MAEVIETTDTIEGPITWSRNGEWLYIGDRAIELETLDMINMERWIQWYLASEREPNQEDRHPPVPEPIGVDFHG